MIIFPVHLLVTIKEAKDSLVGTYLINVLVVTIGRLMAFSKRFASESDYVCSGISPAIRLFYRIKRNRHRTFQILVSGS